MQASYLTASRALCAIAIVALQGCGGGGGSSSPASSTPPPASTDVTAPTVPGNPVATAAGTTRIDFAWSASTDDTGVTAYKVYRDGSLVATLGSATSYSDTGLTASTTHAYTVAACDAAGNCSAQSSTASATTAAPTASDTAAPSVPSGLVAALVSATQINLSWTASTDNVGVTGYRIYRDGSLIATVGTVTAYADTTAAASSHSYTVAACDAAGNCSAQSVAASSLYPAYGAYAVAMRAQGTVNSPMLGVSLVHPARAGIEFVIEPSSSAVSDVRNVLSGSVDASAQTVSNVSPQSLLYIVGGDVRRIPLVADGSAPATRLRKAGSANACKFVVSANHYAVPDSSRFIVSTAGADGICGTGDDGQALVMLDASGGVAVTEVDLSANGAVLGMVRDPSTQAPAGWVYGKQIDYWSASPAVMRQGSDAPITRVVVSTNRSIVSEYANRLTVWDIGNNLSVSETLLDATLTAGSDWQMAGFDADNYYVYLNTGKTLTTLTWKLLRIGRATHAVTQLASGKGFLVLAGMGTSVLYATVTDPGNSPLLPNRLLSINKSTGVAQTLKNTIVTTAYTVLPSSSGVHAMIQGSYNATTKTITAGSLTMIDESDAQLYSANNGVPLMQPDSSAISLASSVNSSRFVIATGYSVSRMFGDATLIVYDAATRAATTLGTLPGAAAYGSDPVLAIVTGTSSNFMAGIAGRVVSQSLQDADEKIYTFDTGVAGSLQYTTSRQ